MRKNNKLLEEFNSLIEDAALDFIGTGTVKEGREAATDWYRRVATFRERLSNAKFVEDPICVRHGDSRP